MLDPARAAAIRILGLDVDGVLTDNAVFLGAVSGERVEFKRFDIQDGLGHALLRGTGIEVVWVSGRPSEATSLRGAELGVGTILQVHPATKVPAIEALLAERGLGWDALAFVGDDYADLPVFERAGLAIAVANARPELRDRAHHVTAASGGHGAVREVIDLLLQATGRWDEAVDRYRQGAGARS
jgi:3-deoxy-D-manno-octulosonate 8-phosphate phosphatase (KDO 8-P phosphatase)